MVCTGGPCHEGNKPVLCLHSCWSQKMLCAFKRSWHWAPGIVREGDSIITVHHKIRTIMQLQHTPKPPLCIHTSQLAMQTTNAALQQIYKHSPCFYPMRPASARYCCRICTDTAPLDLNTRRFVSSHTTSNCPVPLMGRGMSSPSTCSSPLLMLAWMAAGRLEASSSCRMAGRAYRQLRCERYWMKSLAYSAGVKAVHTRAATQSTGPPWHSQQAYTTTTTNQLCIHPHRCTGYVYTLIAAYQWLIRPRRSHVQPPPKVLGAVHHSPAAGV